MPVVILSHSVADYDKWKTYYDADAATRADAGFKEVICGQRADDPNVAYMVFETDNPEVVHQMLADPKLGEVMQEAGVTSPPEVIIIK